MLTVEEYQERITQLESELSEVRRTMQIILDHIPVRVFWKDKDLRYVACNRLFAQDARLESPQEIVGKDDYELSWAEVADLYRADDSAVIESGVARVNFEEAQTRQDGTTSWLLTTKTPLRDEGGNIVGVLGLYEDITERKLAEQRMRQQQAFMRQVMDATPVLIGVKDWDGRFQFVNKTLADIYGTTPEEIVGKTDADFNPNADEVAQYLEADRQVMRSNQELLIPEEQITNANGKTQWLQTMKIPLEGESGNLQVLLVASDITARKEAEEALRQSEEYYRALITNATDVLSILGVDGTFRYISPSFERSFGYTPEEIIGKTAFDNIHPDDIAKVTENISYVVKNPEATLTVVHRWRCKDGSWKVMEATGMNLLANPAVQGIVVNSRDITDRKQEEAEREALQQQVIEAQRQALAELSTPIIPIMDRIIVMPLVGGIDTTRSRDIMRSLLEGISQYRAQIAILDITGVPVVDSGVADHLNRTMQAARLKGAQTIITGVSDAVAETIVDLGIDWSGFETLRDLQTGLVTALERVGFQLTRRTSREKTNHNNSLSSPISQG